MNDQEQSFSNDEFDEKDVSYDNNNNNNNINNNNTMKPNIIQSTRTLAPYKALPPLKSHFSK